VLLLTIAAGSSALVSSRVLVFLLGGESAGPFWGLTPASQGLSLWLVVLSRTAPVGVCRSDRCLG
jgi:hypothetical protein